MGAYFKSKSHINNVGKSKYRIGTTEILDGTQTHKLVLEELFEVHKSQLQKI